jgi:hypothetical protein
MTVWDEIAMYAWQREKFAEQLGVPFRWLRPSHHPGAFEGRLLAASSAIGRPDWVRFAKNRFWLSISP